MVERRRRLGRGLEAMLGSPTSEETAAPTPGFQEVGIEEVFRSPHQPRMHIPDEGIDELAASIESQGLMQPIVVRPRPGGGYELIAGERRWRAAQKAGLGRIAAIVRDVDDSEAMAMALIENIQREALTPLEEADGLRRLLDEFGMTHEEAASAVGKSRPAVSNLLRLLDLGEVARELLQSGALEMGHARALLPLDERTQARIARLAAEKGLSVRQTEALARRAQAGEEASATTRVRDPDTVRLERELSDRLGARVAISHTAKGRGRVVISYTNLDELEGILEHLR
ncbi:MAG: ParB/RepB/Spo0J family partition protein [Gammaproteobacteria bacterium]|nr:ParB/RepB/Spo0J family partition protein [Gammaproteobacteria bacterium]